MLAVDNLSGAKVAGRIITVNHVDNYKIKRAEVCAGRWRVAVVEAAASRRNECLVTASEDELWPISTAERIEICALQDLVGGLARSVAGVLSVLKRLL